MAAALPSGAAPAAPPAVIDYRPEIDGLRALAVLAVIGFHAHIPPLGGGFIGVDVFFVLSGYLITRIIVREQELGHFTLGGFYARRARRILPALVAVGLACLPAAALLMSLEQLRDFGVTLALSAFGASNFWLAATTGYFDAPAYERPLLHTWSLAVEEQYYLLYPLFLLVAARWRRSRVLLALALGALASLALAEWGWRHQANANFYLAPARAWELAAGCLCALAVPGGVAPAAWPRAARDLLAAAGTAAICWSAVSFHRGTPSPSLQMLVPVLGTVAAILFATRDTWTGRLLASRPFVAVGLVSYSAYLWHQPLLAFARLHLDTRLPAAWRVGLVLLTLVLAAVTWRWVEQPWRRRQGSVRAALKAGLAAMLMLAALGIGVHAFAPRIAPPVPEAVKAGFLPPPRAAACFDIPYAHVRTEGWRCDIHPRGEPRPSFALFGDSHAVQLLDAFEQAAVRAGRRGVFAGFSGCPPLLGVHALDRLDDARLDCAALNARMLATVRELGLRDVYLVGKWSYSTEYWDGGRYLNALALRPDGPATLEASRAAFDHGVRATVEAYAQAGARVHFVAQVPQQLIPAPAAYDRAWRQPDRAAAVLDELAVPQAAHRRLQAVPSASFARHVKPPHDTLDFTDRFCDGQRCALGTPGQTWYTDPSHVSPDGAARLVPGLAASLSAAAR